MRLTEEQKEWLISNFPFMKNNDLALHLGCSIRNVGKIGRKMGLKKNTHILHSWMAECAKKATQSNLERGYPPKGYIVPQGDNEERKKKIRESLKKIRQEEKARALFGLPRKTKLKVVKKPDFQIRLRYYLKKKRGYIMGEDGFTFYYNEQTKRSPKIENKPRTGFTFLPKEK